MIIHYSPLYDGEIFVNSQTPLMGVSYVGTQGLLRFLQLRAGVHREVKSPVEREAEYMLAMRGCVNGTTFAKAFAVDALGVAGRLLQWRDRLLMAGWNGECTDATHKKLAALSLFEKEFGGNGMPDCWQEICRLYENGKILDDSVGCVVVECPLCEVPLLVKRTLNAIRDNGTIVVYEAAADDALVYDAANVKVVEFDDLSEAYEWIAQVKSLPQDTVVVNRDNALLNHILYSWNRPLVQSTVCGSNPQLLQLFKLGISIFSRPLNVANLISYLQLPISPIPSGLRYKLAKVLIDEAGFGDKELCDDGVKRDSWERAIDEFDFVNKKGKDSRAEKMAFLAPVRSDYSAGVKKCELVAYLAALKDWAKGKCADKDAPAEIVSQLHEMRTFIASLETSLESFGDVCQYTDVEKLVRQIYRPMNFALQRSEAGAMNVIDDIGRMATGADTLIWLDCQNEEIERDPYEFLGLQEKRYLQGSGVEIPDFALHLQSRRKEMFKRLASAGKVVLVRSTYNGTTRLSEHALIAEIRQILKKLPVEDARSLFVMIGTSSVEGDVEKFAPVPYIELGKEIEYAGRRESNTSLELLIQRPFNYVMRYVAGLYEPNNGQQKDVATVLGLVAHSFFEHIIGDSKGDLDEMVRLTNVEFQKRLNRAIDAKGLVLRANENAAMLDNFSVDLKESMIALVEIMRHLKLRPVGCEISLPESGKLNLEKIGDFGARIDFLLMDEEGKYVVFDFKWSYSARFAQKLEKNTAIQLELYRQAIRAARHADVAAVGYYIMPRKQLVTCDYYDYCDETGKHKLINWVEPVNDNLLFEQVKRSYEFRMEEIGNGRIEEGEMTDFMNIADSYCMKQAELGLCPLDVKEVTKNDEIVSVVKNSELVFKKSKRLAYENADKKPSEVATSYAILKGRLK